MSSSNEDDSIYLHAELLPNIRQITLYVSLPHALTSVQPTIQLSESRKAVTVSLPEPFQDVVETIKLPARVSDGSRRALTTNPKPTIMHNPFQPNGPSHDYSFRMLIDAKETALAPRDEIMDDYVPWTAADMSPSTRIRCRSCDTTFLNPEIGLNIPEKENKAPKIWAWKDLPSGNWAEMMDFWHCHKPDPHEGDAKSEATAALKIEEQNAEVKGYGASSRVEAIPGTILIDTATFLLTTSDCVGLKKVRLPRISCYIYQINPAFSFISPFPFDLGNQKETTSCPWGGLRYYYPRQTSVRFVASQNVAILAIVSAVLESRYPLSRDGFRFLLLYGSMAILATFSGYLISTLFVNNGGSCSLNSAQKSGSHRFQGGTSNNMFIHYWPYFRASLKHKFNAIHSSRQKHFRVSSI